MHFQGFDVGEGEGEGEGDREGEGDFEGEGDLDGEGDREGEGDLEGEGDFVGEGEVDFFVLSLLVVALVDFGADEVGGGVIEVPRHDPNAALSMFVFPFSIRLWKHSWWSSQLGSGSGWGMAVPVGATVDSLGGGLVVEGGRGIWVDLLVISVVPLPEQAVMVEQSVAKLFVLVPEMISVPLHFAN